jgi:DNA polymerase theta
MNYPEALIKVYKEDLGIKTMFDWQVECLSQYLKDSLETGEGNLIYSAPTSAGKTLVSELIMLRNLI